MGTPCVSPIVLPGSDRKWPACLLVWTPCNRPGSRRDREPPPPPLPKPPLAASQGPFGSGARCRAIRGSLSRLRPAHRQPARLSLRSHDGGPTNGRHPGHGRALSRSAARHRLPVVWHPVGGRGDLSRGEEVAQRRVLNRSPDRHIEDRHIAVTRIGRGTAPLERPVPDHEAVRRRSSWGHRDTNVADRHHQPKGRPSVP